MKTPIFIFLMAFPALLCAQDFQFRFEPEGIPVEIQGWRPFSPWAGGASETNPAIVDIDGDGDFDIFSGEVHGNIAFWKNLGNFQLPDYQFITNQFSSIYMQESRANPCFRDLDGDGDLDLIVGDIDSHVHYYQNIGTSQNPEYILITNDLVPAAPPWIVGPELIDIDADGDLDLFGGADQQITYYRNIGTPQEHNFIAVTGNFSNINIPNGWASPEFVDIDADGDYDLFIGERYGKIWFYRNDGDSANYNFTYVTNNYTGIDVGDLASPEFADIDGDGDYDLFVGREANETSRIGDVFYYENVGTPQVAQFQLIAKDYLAIDLGYFVPKPQFADLNGDGAPDLLAGIASVLDYFANVGDSVNPQFQLIQEQYQGITQSTIAPCLVDIDADGDYDLLCGEGAIPGPPSVSLYLNEGTPRNPIFELYSETFVTNPNFEVYIYPVVADIDVDGDYDLFIFDSENRFYFYQNNGTPQWPNFVLITNQWQGIHQFPYPANTWYGFSFGDLDHDGDLDLLIGSPEQDNLYFYRNQGTPQSPQMILETTDFLQSDYPYFYTPYLVDIDDDGDLDLFTGQGSGGIFFFRNITGDFPVNITLTPAHPPITIPASGGNFRYNIAISNQGSATQNTDFWVMVQLPNGSWYGPIYGPVSRNLSPGANISRNRNQSIPARAPAGTYHYEGRVGIYPDTVWARSSFTLEKQGDSGQTGITVEDWNNWGEEWGESENQVITHNSSFIISCSPNPANPTTIIRFTVPTAGHVKVSVYDISGRLVAALIDDKRAAGTQEVVFDASQQASGVYLVRLETSGSGPEGMQSQTTPTTVSGKVVILK